MNWKHFLFTRNFYYRGRNGSGIQKGIDVTVDKQAGVIFLNPINSKGKASDAARIEIELDQFEEICKFVKSQ